MTNKNVNKIDIKKERRFFFLWSCVFRVISLHVFDVVSKLIWSVFPYFNKFNHVSEKYNDKTYSLL